MKTKKLVSVLLIIVIAIFMLTMVLGTIQAVNAASKVKVTWDANGGKIGAAKTTVTSHNKGVKIGKFPKTPTKSGYTFQGWFTAKKGGTKLSKTTKIPTKNMVVYAHWKKGKKVLSASERELVGTWCAGGLLNTYYLFRDDGTYSCHSGDSSYSPTRIVVRGLWRESGGIVYMSERTQTGWAGTYSPGNKKLVWKKVSDYNMHIRFDVNKYTGKRAFVDLKQPDRYFSFEAPPSWVYF